MTAAGLARWLSAPPWRWTDGPGVFPQQVDSLTTESNCLGSGAGLPCPETWGVFHGRAPSSLPASQGLTDLTSGGGPMPLQTVGPAGSCLMDASALTTFKKRRRIRCTHGMRDMRK
jgi:hypothetical protein